MYYIVDVQLFRGFIMLTSCLKYLVLRIHSSKYGHKYGYSPVHRVVYYSDNSIAVPLESYAILHVSLGRSSLAMGQRPR